MSRLQSFLLSVLFTSFFVIGTSAQAEFAKPFGNFAWDDNVLVTLQKLDSMDAENITLQLELEKHEFKKGVIPKNKAELEKILKELFVKQYQMTPEKESDSSKFEKFLNSDGKEAKYYVRKLKILADNIMLASVKCTISLTFEANPEVAAIKPESSYALGNRIIISPLLNLVSLKSSADNLLENFEKIKQIVADKYYSNLSDKNQFLKYGVIQRPNMQGISGEIKKEILRIQYSNDAPSELLEQYKKFKAAVANKQTTDTKDSAAGL